MKRFLTCITSVLWLAACHGTPASVSEDSDGQLATNVSIFSSKENQKEWVLHADAVNFEHTQHAQLSNPQLLLKQKGTDSARVSGERGRFDYEHQQVSLEGDSVLESLTEKIRITAPRFFYDITQDRIWSDARTVITRGTAKSIAKNGVETDSKLSKITLKKHATRLPQNIRELSKEGV